MRIERLSRKEFKEKTDSDKLLRGASAVTHRGKGEESVIYIPGRANTHELLHEIYHAKYSPQLERIEAGEKWNTPDQLAEEELRAEYFAYERTGKSGISLYSICGAARTMLDFGYKPAVVMGSINRALDKVGIEPLTQEERSDLWWWMRDYKGGAD